MNNRTLLAFIGTVFASSVFTGCALPDGRVTVASPLKENVRYELRRAVGAKEAFEPKDLRSVYFVLKPEAPPMIASTRSGSRGTLSVRTTAYCHTENDHLRFGRLSAIGRPLKYGTVRSAAADWSRFPLGTQFRIKSQPGVVYEVDDYGSALVGSNTIDLYYPTRSGMNRWGVRNCDIEVINWGSFSSSLDQLLGSTHYPHVRQMVRDIQTRLGTKRQVTDRSSTTPTIASSAPSTLLTLGTSRSL
jgi:3D (Asp-Asp-Asp) domain-containing protein